MRFFCLAWMLPWAFLVPLSSGTVNAQQQPLTVKAINRESNGTAPQGASWSPDGSTLAFIPYEPLQALPSAQPGDLVGVDPRTGRIRSLVSSIAMDALGSKEISLRDQDRRARYNMSDFLWSPDSRHLLLDRNGLLFLWDLTTGLGQRIVDTGSTAGEDPQFSPDGRRVAYLRGHNLYVHSVDGGTEQVLTSTPAGETPDTLLNGEVDWLYEEELDARTNYHWSPDSSGILYVQSNETKVPRYPIEDFIPVHPTLDWQRFPQPGDPNPAVRVGFVPATGGETRWLNVPLKFGDDYIPRFGWVDTHTAWVEVLERRQTVRHIFLVDIQTGEAHEIAADSDPKYLEDNYDLWFLPHGRFLMKSWRDGHMHLYLYRFDPTHTLDGTAMLERQLTTGDFEVGDLWVPMLGDSLREVLFTSNEGSPLEQQLWAVSLEDGRRHRLTQGPGVHEPLVSPDGRWFGDTWSTLASSERAAVCSTIASSKCQMIWQGQAPAQASGTATRIVPYTAADGKTITYGYLTVPTALNGNHSIPLILNPYGGPLPAAAVLNKQRGQGGRFDQLLAQHGFAVLDLDNRGSGGRGRDFQQTDYRDFGASQLADQLSALDQALAADSRLDPKRIGWWGWSWGGFFTIYAMTHSDRIRAGVAVAPGSTDARDYDSAYTERYLGLPAENEIAYKASEVNQLASKIQGRLLLAQGTGDDNVHMNSALQFINGLIQADVPYDLQIFPQLTHSLATPEARDLLFERILYQFENYLKPIP